MDRKQKKKKYSSRKRIDYFFLVLKGILMGTANKIPGVSGGTIAIILDFYEELINSLKKLNLKSILVLRKRGFKSFSQRINAPFLTAIFTGTIISYFSVSLLLDYLFIHYGNWVWSFFFGLIFGTAYSIWYKLPPTKKTISLGLLGALIGLGISFLDPLPENANYFFIFFCGFISVCGMTLPGLSGSFLLILLGNYALCMVYAVNELYASLGDIIQWDFSHFSDESRQHLLTVMLLFITGSICGIVLLAQMLSHFIRKYENNTLSLIAGFLLGSLGTVWPWKLEKYLMDASGNPVRSKTGRNIINKYQRYLPEVDSELFINIGLICIGFLIIYLIDKFQKAPKLKTEHNP